MGLVVRMQSSCALVVVDDGTLEAATAEAADLDPSLAWTVLEVLRVACDVSSFVTLSPSDTRPCLVALRTFECAFAECIVSSTLRNFRCFFAGFGGGLRGPSGNGAYFSR
jgi:hypothetical protein